ncbi:MAG: hypothetical protein GX973_06925 [Firmicutes bacterium]|nr:hypothetical protein [Bacillota bacterium]
MGLLIPCSAKNFDTLAGVLAASKIYAGSRPYLMTPPAQKIKAFLAVYPRLLPPVIGGEPPANPGLVVVLGPCPGGVSESYRAVLSRAKDIHLFSNCPADRDLFPGARPFLRAVAAVTTILVEEIRRRNIPLSDSEAGLLALGIYEATEALTSPVTTALDVTAVQYLWESGLELGILRTGLQCGDNAASTIVTPRVPPGNATGPPGVSSDSKEEEGFNDDLPGEPAWLGWESLLPLLAGKVPERFRGKLLLVGQAAARRESEVYLVGGIIRDLLLGREPANDLDLIVIPAAIPLAQDLQKKLGGKIVTYEELGTATLFLPGGTRLDLATARRELYPLPGALPRVQPSNLKFDLYRRDFTINSMACSLLPESFGQLFDYFGGRRDLVDGLLRTMYNLSFVDDPLRILRAVRFEKRLNFRLEDSTRKSMLKAINGRALEKVSRHRLAQEMNALYLEPDPPGILKRLAELGALGFIYPRLQTSAATWQRLDRMAEALRLTRHWDWESPPELVPAYLSALLYDMEEDGRVVLLSRLFLSRAGSRRVLAACAGTPRVLRQLSRGELRPSTLVRLLQDFPPEGILLTYLLAESGPAREQLEAYVNQFRRVRTRLGGNDLIAMGLSPGPIFQRILKGLREAVLDGRVHSLEEERDYIKSFIQREG